MSEESHRCAALTKAGAQCKRNAQADSAYCYTHRHYAGPLAEPVAAAEAAAATVTIQRAELEALVVELNELAKDLQKLQPEYSPPPYSSQGMMNLLRSNTDRFTPDAVRNLQEMLEGTGVEDFKDIETWKGMWYTLNYLVQLEASERSAGLRNRLSGLPGISTVGDLKEMLADTPPEEFLKVDTWKGMWFIANYELQNQASGLKRRLMGGEDEEAD